MTQKIFNTSMFQLARQRLCMSQKELSEKSGLSQSTLSKFEIGLSTPNLEQIKHLAYALDVQPSFFYIQSPAYSSMTPMYRRKSTISQKEVNRAAAIGAITVAQIDSLLRATGLNNQCSLPYISPEEYPDGSAGVARAAREYMGLPSGPIVDITSCMEDHGVMIFFRKDFPEKIDGYTIYPSNFSFPYTFVNSLCQGERVRMTLAHELGHIFMHKFDTPNCEEEAWDFAGEFLMPEDEFTDNLPQKLTNLRALLPLKFKWKVSLGSIVQRLKKLEIINDNTFKYLRIQLSQYHKTEPYPVKMEQPELCKQLLTYCIEILNYTQKDLEAITGFHEEEFKYYYQSIYKTFGFPFR